MIRTHLIAACLVITACGVARADDPIVLVWSSLAGGGGVMSGSGFDLASTVGQSGISTIQISENFTLYNGYWVPSSVTIRTHCRADFNRDGTADFFDYDDYVAAFEAGLPSADLNSDGAIDFFDYDAFVGFFETGC